MLCYYLLVVSYLVSTPLSETEQIIQLQKKLAWAELKIQVLEARLRLQRIKKYGNSSGGQGRYESREGAAVWRRWLRTASAR